MSTGRPAEPGSTEGVPTVTDGISDERSRRRAMLVRAGIYIFATHLFAGFVILLFTLGDRR